MEPLRDVREPGQCLPSRRRPTARVIRAYVAQNMLQRYQEMSLPDPSRWAMLVLAADDQDYLDFVGGVRARPSRDARRDRDAVPRRCADGGQRQHAGDPPADATAARSAVDLSGEPRRLLAVRLLAGVSRRRDGQAGTEERRRRGAIHEDQRPGTAWFRVPAPPRGRRTTGRCPFSAPAGRSCSPRLSRRPIRPRPARSRAGP